MRERMRVLLSRRAPKNTLSRKYPHLHSVRRRVRRNRRPPGRPGRLRREGRGSPGRRPGRRGGERAAGARDNRQGRRGWGAGVREKGGLDGWEFCWASVLCALAPPACMCRECVLQKRQCVSRLTKKAPPALFNHPISHYPPPQQPFCSFLVPPLSRSLLRVCAFCTHARLTHAPLKPCASASPPRSAPARRRPVPRCAGWRGRPQSRARC